MGSFVYNTQKFLEKYEKQISVFFLVGGFIFDSFTLQRPDKTLDLLIILSYVVITGISIILLNYFFEHPPKKKFVVLIKDVLPFLIQFSFGGLFSAFLIFYSKSASLTASWPFLAILLFLLVGNEFFRRYYERLTFQVGIYYMAVISFCILVVPVLLRKINAGIFILSGLISLVIIILFTRILFRSIPDRYKKSRVDINRTVAGIFLVINILYFTNLIPPIPLIMVHSGIFHSVLKSGNDYIVLGERSEWYEELPIVMPKVVHLKQGENLYAFSSIFAPTNLNTNIIHDWQYFDESASNWVSVTQVRFNISGGRDEGYRTFSKKESLFAGKWRVNVKTQSGQTVGQIRFNIEPESDPIILEEKVF